MWPRTARPGGLGSGRCRGHVSRLCWRRGPAAPTLDRAHRASAPPCWLSAASRSRRHSATLGSCGGHRQNSVPVQATGPCPARTGSGRPRPSLWWESPGELGTPEPCSRPPGPRDPSPTSLKLVPGVQPPQPPARNPPVPPCPEPSAAGAGTRSRPLVPRGVAAWLAPRVGRAEGGPVPTRRGPLGPAGKHRGGAGCHHLPALEGQHAGLLAPSPCP